jgi:predicted glycosyltransferase
MQMTRLNKRGPMNAAPGHIWIDLDNSPHVPFFVPIIDELRRRGYPLLLTSRDAFQVTQLTRLHGVPCSAVGRHYGRNKVKKVLGLLLRTAQLVPYVWQKRPDLAVSHGSRAQAVVAKLLRIPSLLIADYEHVTHVTKPNVLMVPEVIPPEATTGMAKRVIRYPGIKEDVYVAGYRPGECIRSQLGIEDREIVVTVRPPATEAHYHNRESEVLFAALMDFLGDAKDTRTIVLPRNDRQKREIEEQWSLLLERGTVIIPEHTLHGLDLIWSSDLVVSGGGTMNREAAALGVPVYSIFRGRMGAVDRYLARNGRLVIVETAAAVKSDIRLVRRPTGSTRVQPQRNQALEAIVSAIVGMLPDRDAHPRSPS